MNINAVLSQIRTMRQQISTIQPNNPTVTPPTTHTTATTHSTFSNVLKDALTQVNHTQNQATQMTQAFELGDPRADLAQVMLSMQKSTVAFKATVEVRNRFVQAYQDIMNMPL